MQSWKDFQKELMKNPEFVREYKKLEPKYKLISQLIGARLKKGLTQKELAQKIGTKQSAIARIEAGNVNPTVNFLEKVAQALGQKLVIEFR
ncbi:transcriptional regulator [Candidatus Woesebacteria bacterium RIFCSPHIGHO2_12_FULL_44_11]|uniref:Transcriptional regulator n=1 Tax=Candidatus Woesebacteria bacterium RIFCSPLOWO2_01_FULL_44_14 TaxID=1802525 RepID=A0A1F8C2F3_9BACT|nr:MAG: transcriptional regulator [Candidatus Woesebacteria bacterium RIFCSPHIGHO2_12_FULL_44_11]OGM69785.1 MAG: transcriptional regulator [Candidatus Woesebacteria bacterium RIFCSPLOWO2_01_FULL_44_14]